jgi:hypothetical protein
MSEMNERQKKGTQGRLYGVLIRIFGLNLMV